MAMTTTYRCVCSAAPVLRAVSLAPGLHATSCDDCHGHWLAMDDYRRWVARGPAPLDADAADLPALRPDAAVPDKARACPACQRFMERLRVGRSPDFRLDRCSACQHIWLDAGEWAALAEAGLATQLGEILSDGWQRQLRDAEAQARREADLRERHGDACIDEIARIRAWLATQPQRETLLALLRSGW
jgi:Zn-finger nucleic acid-binding protein